MPPACPGEPHVGSYQKAKRGLKMPPPCVVEIHACCFLRNGFRALSFSSKREPPRDKPVASSCALKLLSLRRPAQLAFTTRAQRPRPRMLPRLAMVAFLCSQPRRRIALTVTAALCLRPANLSLNPKKPASVAGFLYIRHGLTCFTALFCCLSPLLSRHTALVAVFYSDSKLPLRLA